MFQFTLTGPAVTTALLLTLVNIAIVTPEERETAFRYLGPGYTCIDIGWSSKQLSYSTQSVTECAFKALNREATFFTYNKRSQFCSTYLEGVKVELTNEQDSNEMSFYKADTWRKAYRVDMQSRVDIYKFFLKIGPHSAWNTDRYAYRNKLIDSWNYLPIDKVKFEALKFGAKAITLLFDGRNSTIDNWFQYARLISSPWTDLNATNFNMFSVHGNK
ncbi:uncharacterized protein LOC106880665 [Octopus bimaculoides]|uniref:Apple domain-containing protein n=1 Tax=Octopus bimaculoides TaxID=37653 RepID=A0A0L8FWQ8_OCTBM|nr:uncharacterized protein LOC106880665 [Octopus bimaculoides]|eukprot:XP_014786200.1 PREDICTED: uncharacterized protein LOC106880665 [Octopus bimaculoides]